MENMPIPTAEVEWELDSTLIVTTNIMEINAITKQLVSHENQVITVTGPEKAGIAVASKEEIEKLIADVRAEELEAYADNTVKEPLITQELKGSAVKTTSTDKFGATVWTLANGVKVIVKQTDFKADELLFKATAPGGKSILTDAQSPSADLLPSLVQSSGVGKFSMIDLGKQLAGKQVHVNPTVGNYEHGFSGSSSPKDVETLLQLVYLYTTSPRWDQNDYDVMVNQYRAVLANATSNPNFIFQDSLMNTLYGHNPRRQQLSTERLDKVGFGDMPGIYTELFGSPVVGKSQNFIYTFVGNIDPNVLKPLVEKYLGSLPAGKTALAPKDDKAAPAEGRVENRFQTAMQAPKTTVRYTFTGEIPYTMENDLALDVLSQILDIRYTASVREEKGGTYSVGVAGALTPLAKPRYQLLVHFDTDPAMADELMGIVMEEIETIAKDGPKAEDLNKVKEYLVKQRPDDLKKNSVWMTYLHENYTYKTDYNTGYDAALNGLDAARIKAIAAKVLGDGNLVKIIMEPMAAE
jgi:zinc protease